MIATDLGEPSIGKEEQLKTVEEDVEDEAPRGKELAAEPTLGHCCRSREGDRSTAAVSGTKRTSVQARPDEEGNEGQVSDGDEGLKEGRG